MQDDIVIVSPNRNMEEERQYAFQQEHGEARIRALAKALSNKFTKAVAIRMPSGALCTVGGETLVQALARGGQPVE